MKIIIAITAALLTSAVMAADASAPADAANEKKICRNFDPAIGSNLIRRICKTPEEWAKQKQVDRPTTQEQADVKKFRDITTQYASPR